MKIQFSFNVVVFYLLFGLEAQVIVSNQEGYDFSVLNKLGIIKGKPNEKGVLKLIYAVVKSYLICVSE